MIALLATLALQATTAIPSADEPAVLQPIDEAFKALESQDPAALLRQVHPDGRVTAVGTLTSGFSGMRSSNWTEYAARMKPENSFIERIADPVIKIDGDVALVWAPFTIEVKGKITACGIDHFDMVRQNGAWKIMNITFSSRTTGCPGQ